MPPIDDPFGTPAGGGNGSPPDDRTMIMPRPGGRAPEPAGGPRGGDPYTPPPMASLAPLSGRGDGLNPLEQAAGPLLAMLTRLRNTIAHPAPASLRAQLLGYLRQFEEKARQAGVAPDEVMLARYVLCTALDEAVLSTPWGSTSDWGKQSLLITLHNEAWGGEKVFQLLEHCLQNPHQRLHLLELLYLCTSLGFEGRYRVMHDGRSQLEALRERTAAVIRSTRGEYEHELSPHWRGLSVMRDRLSQYLPPWVGIAIGLALLLALLFGLRMKLAADAEPVFKRIHAIGEIPVQAIDRPAVQPRVIERPRLARFLADDIKAQRVAVEDAVDRSVVTIRGDELFASASASVRDEFQPLLLRIADALRKVKGQVLVTGHSDNRPIATLRYPSNWKSVPGPRPGGRRPARRDHRRRRPLHRRRAQRHRAGGDQCQRRRPRTQPPGGNHRIRGGRAMKGFLNFFARWVVPVLGLLALSLIIWFLGPLLRLGNYEPLASATSRWVLIVLLFLVWIGFRVLRIVQARRNAAKVMQSLAEVSAPDAASVATAEELATLKQRMDEALALLKRAKLGGSERRNLYELPWYVIIGPPGSGKTTALMNSGLDFPLAAQMGAGAIRGVGGTRNCDWWFTDEAVLLDTAGRYTTQDSHAQVDKAAWLGFLDLLKTQRKRRPIDGAFIAISLSDLLLGSDAERAAHAQAIRARIQELYQQLGVRFPIYVMLTKFDLVPGFMEFFDSLNREERAQVWG